MLAVALDDPWRHACLPFSSEEGVKNSVSQRKGSCYNGTGETRLSLAVVSVLPAKDKLYSGLLFDCLQNGGESRWPQLVGYTYGLCFPVFRDEH